MNSFEILSELIKFIIKTRKAFSAQQRLIVKGINKPDGN